MNSSRKKVVQTSLYEVLNVRVMELASTHRRPDDLSLPNPFLLQLTLRLLAVAVKV